MLYTAVGGLRKQVEKNQSELQFPRINFCEQGQKAYTFTPDHHRPSLSKSTCKKCHRNARTESKKKTPHNILKSIHKKKKSRYSYLPRK